jgi:DNA-directed RNA polymerase specialized sigma24 family protein
VERAVSTEIAANAQELLRLFLAAEEQDEASRLLERLIEEYADPVIKAVVRRKMGIRLDEVRRQDRIAGAEAAKAFAAPKWSVELDAEDVHATCVLDLLEHLRALRKTGGDTIRDFRGYVGRIALNAFAGHLRRRYPERHRLRRKLWYLARGRTPARGFAWWRDEASGETLCGFQAWKDQPLDFTANYRRWQQDPFEFQEEIFGGRDPRRMALPEALAQVLNWMGAPVAVDDLVDGLAELLGIREVEIITDG